jgi:hypothetical protein
VVCSTCGYETQVGNRFCGMCGTPLPHRPLTAPGAQGTLSFTRVPLESAKPAGRQPIATPLEEAREPTAPTRTGILIEMPKAESRTTEALRPDNVIPMQQRPSDSADEPLAQDMVPEVPLDDYVKSFRYVPPTDPKEVTMRGEAHELQADALALAGLTAKPNETASAENPASISPAEDIQERLGLEDFAATDERHDRPRFLDFSESPRPSEEPVPPGSSIVGPSFPGLGGTSQVAAEAAHAAEPVKPSRRKGLIWIAVALLLVAIVFGVLKWGSKASQMNNGLIEVIKMKFHNIRHGNQAPQSASSADTNGSKRDRQFEEQPKAQDQNPAPSQGSQGSTSVNNAPAASNASNGADAASSPQDTTGTVRNQLPAGQGAESSGQNSPLTRAQSTTQSRPTQEPAMSGSTSKAAIVSGTPDRASNLAAKSKAKPESDQRDDKKEVPGEEELAKANDASDAAATVAWLWKATAKGNPDAPVRLADLYVTGDGVPRSCEQALVLLKTAADKENARARNRLAAMYSSGICVQRNRVEAYRWLTSALAADPNSHWALQNRDLIWQQMTPDERAAAQQHR